MTAIALHPADTFRAAGVRPGWPWLSTLLISLAFFLAAHEWNASQHWQKLLKGEVAAMATEESEGRASRQVGFLLLGAVGAGLLLFGRAARSYRPAPLLVFAVAALLIWALLSAAWSADVAVTLKRQVVLLCMLVGTLGLIRRFEIDRITEIAFVHTLLVLLIGVIAEVTLAQRGHPGEEYRFAGTLHPNHAGINASLLLLCSLFLARRRADWRFLCVAAIAVVILLMTKSRTALSAAIAAATAFIALAWSPRQKFVLGMAVFLFVCAGAMLVAADAFPHLTDTLLLNRKSSDPTTLTGRTMIWDFAWSQIREDWGRILVGFGFGGFWTRDMAEALSQRAHFSLSEGHNAYLDVLLQLGVVGLFFYLCAIVGSLVVFLVAIRRLSPAPFPLYSSRVRRADRFCVRRSTVRTADPTRSTRRSTVDAPPLTPTLSPEYEGEGARRGANAAIPAFAVALIVFSLVHHFAESAMTAPIFPTLILWAVIGSAALRNPMAPARGNR